MSALEDFLEDELAPDDAPSDDVVRGYMAALRSPVDSEERAEAEARPPWTIEDVGAADWAARKIQRARRAMDDRQAEYDRQRAALDGWLSRETEALESDVAFFEGMLGDWLRREINADPSKKPKVSRDLPCGATVKRTPARPSLVVDDEEALVEWLRDESPEHVEFVPKFSKSDVKKLVVGDGLKVPGVRLEPGQHGWKVET